MRRICRARKAADLTQTPSSPSGSSSRSPTVSNVEAGRVNLTVGQLARFADALGSDPQLRMPLSRFPLLLSKSPWGTEQVRSLGCNGSKLGGGAVFLCWHPLADPRYLCRALEVHPQHTADPPQP